MKERIKNGANLLESHVFRFDFLNGSFDDLPDGLKAIVNDPERRKKLVIFINPPYAEAATSKTQMGTGKNKPGVATEHPLNAKYKPLIGAAANELFALFLIRISQELRGCVLGQFSTLKHVLAPNYKAFRQVFNSTLERVFLVPAPTFDNVHGKFPIGYFVWQTGTNEVFQCAEADCFAPSGDFLQTKTLFPVSRNQVVNRWLKQFFNLGGEQTGWLCFVPNDFQHNDGVFITWEPSESLIKESRIAAITQKSTIPFCVYFSVRHCIEDNWIIHNDQILFPADTWKTDYEFQLDCIAFTLFHGKNRISCKAGVNHWIPFAEAEVDAKDAYKSHFMVDFLRNAMGGAASGRASGNGARQDAAPPILVGSSALQQDDLFGAEATPRHSHFSILHSQFSTAASRVLDAGRRLWRYYHSQPNAMPDASFYDIRAHFQGFKPNGHMNPDSTDIQYTHLIGDLRAEMKNLAAKIAPKVHEHGFLR